MCRKVLAVEYIAGLFMDDFFCPNCGWPANQKAWDKMDKEKLAAMRKQRRSLDFNKTGTLCLGCSHDLWYESKANILACLKCGTLIPKGE
jgi:predicted RNA-binding Zn-ribbon protein involved in translation (DUF1610 family)